MQLSELSKIFEATGKNLGSVIGSGFGLMVSFTTDERLFMKDVLLLLGLLSTSLTILKISIDLYKSTKKTP
ncbi:hypothetical protein FUAX_55690 (plasmid) [Fulvitalea axinellae]|uniref:Uncharacterized protein n=1 Tax=Fulvitalea axinellae TaxID=1182444 RepID=A0AAU9CZG7_9BACT|nr:hypothetical protein FUAX_55690 [Fulvitalea axinellae]